MEICLNDVVNDTSEKCTCRPKHDNSNAGVKSNKETCTLAEYSDSTIYQTRTIQLGFVAIKCPVPWSNINSQSLIEHDSTYQQQHEPIHLALNVMVTPFKVQ